MLYMHFVVLSPAWFIVLVAAGIYTIHWLATGHAYK
jgi:hypothetical protein